MSITKRDMAVAALAAAAGAGAIYLLLHHAERADSPILVRDGSIILESPAGEKLDDYIKVSDNLVVHPDGKKLMKKLARTGIVPNVAKCRGNNACRLEVTLNDVAASKVIIGSGMNGKGLWISSSIPFSHWNTTDKRKWTLSDGTLKVKEAKVYGTDQADGTALCTAAGCEISGEVSN